MKRFLFFLALFAGQAVAAPSFSFQLNEVRFPELVRLVYSDVLQRSYVIDTDTLKNEDSLTVHVRNKSGVEVEAYLVALLDARGFAVSRKGGVDVIGRKSESVEPHKEIFVYRPRYRSVSYLQDLLGGLFPKGAFSGQRQIANAQQPIIQSGSMATGQGAKHSPSAQPAAVDTGNSAYSLLDKSQQDAIVFQGESKDVEKLAGLLVQLDQPSAELVVKAVVYEVRTEQTEGSAITLAASILSGKLGISIDGGASQGNAVKLKFNSLEAVYSALSGDKRFKLVSSPTMRVKSGNSARFVAGSEVPVLGNVSYQNNGQAVQSVDYKSSGVILDLKPQVREDVTDLTIFQQISSFVPTTTGVNQSPTLLKRELQTQVSAKADEMIVLGGLEESQATESEQGLSFLPRFLRSSGDDRTRTEIMVVLHVQRI